MLRESLSQHSDEIVQIVELDLSHSLDMGRDGQVNVRVVELDIVDGNSYSYIISPK